MNIGKSIKIGTRELERTLLRETPTILTGLAVTGIISAVALAIKATPNAVCILEKEAEHRDHQAHELGDESTHITPLEAIQLTWKCYIPTGISMGFAIVCVISANSVSLRRNATLVSVYNIASSSLREYQDKVVELVGKNKATKIQDEIAQDRLDKNPVAADQIILTNSGETLCYDSLSGRYFKSDLEKIRQTVNEFNADLLLEMFKTLNEFYNLLDLESIEMGESVGWSANDGLLQLTYSAKLASNGEPCVVLDYGATFPYSMKNL